MGTHQLPCRRDYRNHSGFEGVLGGAWEGGEGFTSKTAGVSVHSACSSWTWKFSKTTAVKRLSRIMVMMTVKLQKKTADRTGLPHPPCSQKGCQVMLTNSAVR